MPGDSLAARRAALQHWTAQEWGRPRPSRMIWFHAASVGEALTAEPVIRRMRTALPGAGFALTWSSPSVGRFPHRFGADFVDAAPPETRAGATAVFSAIQPDLLVFSRSDLWPEMLLAARERQVPVAVIGGSLPAGSARLRSPARQFFGPLVQPIRFVGALSAGDAARWVALGVRESAVLVTGDPRHDQILERPTSTGSLRGLMDWSAAGRTVVAGSLERDDETVVLEGFAILRRHQPDARLLIAPHDPESRTLARLLLLSEKNGVPAELLGESDPVKPVVILSRRGMLADAYLVGDVSYVGGGFRERGLHAVIEPAVYGLPVIHGPLYGASPDAGRLVEVGGTAVLPRPGAGRALGEQLKRWVADRRGPPEGGHGGEEESVSGSRGGQRAESAFTVGLTTTPSNVMVRGTTNPAVSTVTMMSPIRLFSVMRRFAISDSPETWPESTRSSDGRLAVAMPQNAKKVVLVILNGSPCGWSVARAASIVLGKGSRVIDLDARAARQKRATEQQTGYTGRRIVGLHM